jgi:methyl-accepting chemotaxis protein
MAKIVAVLGRMRTNADGAYTTDDSIAVSKWWSASEFYNSEMSKVFAEVDSRAKLIEVQAEQDKAAQEAAAAAVAVKTVKPKDNGIPQVVTAAAVMITPVHANDMIKAGKDRFSADLIKGVAEKFSAKSKETLALTDVTNQGFNQMIYGVLASVVIGIAIGVYLLIILPRSVSGPILQLTKKVDALSRGEDISMSEEVKVLEFKGLSASVERMRTAQELMMQRLKKNS